MFDVHWNFNVLLHEIHIGGKGRVRHPFTRRTWCRFLQHSVDLLQRKTLHLRDKEVGKGQTNTAEAAPHEEDIRAEVCVALSGAD